MISRRLVRALLAIGGALTAVYLALPFVVIIPASFSNTSYLRFPPQGLSQRWYDNFFADPVWLDSAADSLRIAVLVTIVSVVLGTLCAFGMVRGRFPLRSVVASIVLAPLLVPYVITALAMYLVFLRAGLTQTTLGFVLAHSALAIPYVFINVTAALSQFDRRLEMAAMGLGARPLGTFFRVTLPLILPSILSGALFAFVISWDEVVISIFLSGPELTTLPVQIWSGVRVQIDPTVAAVSGMLLFLTLAVFCCSAVARLLWRRGRSTRTVAGTSGGK